MPQRAESLLGDAAGASVTLSPEGVELPNKSSRRRIDFNEAGFCRVQWADSQAAGVTGLRTEYTLDEGQTWVELTPTLYGVGAAYDNDCGDWITVPEALVLSPYNVLVRALVVGNNATSKVTYVTIQLR